MDSYDYYILLYCPTCGKKIEWGLERSGELVQPGTYEMMYAPAILIDKMQGTMRPCQHCLTFYVAHVNMELQLDTVWIDKEKRKTKELWKKRKKKN